MSQVERTVKCPECAREFTIGMEADLSHLICPNCEGEIPEQALRPAADIAEEIAPGFRPGQRFGNYVIESVLGTGGMAVVFKGRQLSLNRHVAIKVLPKEFMQKKLFVERFESEAAVLASLNHPNIVSVIDRGAESDTYYIVMEYVQGETLKDVIQRETTVPPEKLFPIAEQVLAGLAYAHKRGVVHRDIKPGNIMINADGIVKIADFGLAHLAKANGGLDVTRENQAMGTLKYMAPEQLGDARGVDGRADLYSFGVCIYECLTGRLPLGMFKMPSEWDESLDLRWDDVILRGLKMDPEERFSNAESMAKLIHEIATTPRFTAVQREEAEEEAAKEAAATAAAPRVISPVACAQCGTENPPEAMKCEKCGGSLDDLFEKCPKCEAYSRLDVSPCPKCGVNLTEFRAKRRGLAEKLQNDAKRLAANGDFERALSNLRKLLKFRTREYAPLRRSAEAWIERISRRRDHHLQRIYEAGERMIAEGHAVRGLEIWQTLPEGYKDVQKRREELLEAKKKAEEEIAAGNKLYESGGLEAAIKSWTRAAIFFPHDQHLNKVLSRARIELGNLNLRRSYVEDAKSVAARGKFNDAMNLCRKALELDAQDPAALAFLKRLEEHRAATSKIQSKKKKKWSVKDVIPVRPKEHRQREPMTRRQIVKLSVSIGLVLLVLLTLGVGIPMYKANREGKASLLLSEANTLRQAGNETGAMKMARRVVEEYPNTIAAARAKELEDTTHALLSEGQGLCNAADMLARTGTLDANIAGFTKYRDLLGGSIVTESGQLRAYASTRLEELRKLITDELLRQADKLQNEGKWRQAMRTYARARGEFRSPEELIAPLADRAQRRIKRCEDNVAAAEQAGRAGQWQRALEAGLAALDFVPEDEDAARVVREAVGKIPPPEGMVLVPPGEYSVGGAAGNKAKKVNFPHGFYIDRNEVTREAFDNFLKAMKRGPLPKPSYVENFPEQEDPALPVACVTWKEADEFAKWAGKLLPTEDMFEAAAKGLESIAYPWGDGWKSGNGSFCFGPSPLGQETKDVSPCGAQHMAGNVAEWTATSMEAAAQESPERPRIKEDGRPISYAGEEQETLPGRFRVVKGSAWIGLEEGRLSKAVARPLEYQDIDTPLLLTPDEAARDKAVIIPSDLEIGYNGPADTNGATANVLVRRWVPAWKAWVGARLVVAIGNEIGRTINVMLNHSNGARTLQKVNLSTGCTLKSLESRGMEIALPSGATLWVPRKDFPTSQSISPADGGQIEPFLVTLAESAESASRMAGREEARYINVGFRCMKWIWTPAAYGEIRRVEQE